MIKGVGSDQRMGSMGWRSRRGQQGGWAEWDSGVGIGSRSIVCMGSTACMESKKCMGSWGTWGTWVAWGRAVHGTRG